LQLQPQEHELCEIAQGIASVVVDPHIKNHAKT
jgi:hypothetical protein